jgi:hypothetical protein
MGVRRCVAWQPDVIGILQLFYYYNYCYYIINSFFECEEFGTLIPKVVSNLEIFCNHFLYFIFILNLGTPAARMKKVPSTFVKKRSRELTSVFEAFMPYDGMEGRLERIWITEIATDGIHLVRL